MINKEVNKKVINKVNDILESTDKELVTIAGNWILEQAGSYGNVVDVFTDLLAGSISGGMVNFLIHNQDTHKFFDYHYYEIIDLKDDIEDSLGEPLNMTGDIKNWLAWFAFEETVRSIAHQVEEVVEGVEIL